LFVCCVRCLRSRCFVVCVLLVLLVFPLLFASLFDVLWVVSCLK